MEKIAKFDTPSIFVLVTGATGKQDGELTRQLLEKGHRVRAMTRDLESRNLVNLELKNLGAELNIADQKLFLTYNK